ncbi:MAG: rhamnulokinase family protein [Planctomycetota bacterium]
MPTSAHIAIDLGAESGRVIVGTLSSGRLELHEVHRFRHLPVPTPAGLCWDLTGLWRQILDGLATAAKHLEGAGLVAESVGVDTWGVDWTLLSERGVMLGLPRCYRDPAFDGAFAEVTSRVSARHIYDATGIQLMPFNTLYQYHGRTAQEPGVFDEARTLQFMPDLLHWLLCGEAKIERTIASTSQMVDVRTGDWNRELLGELGLNVGPLVSPVAPGTSIGTLRADVAEATGLPASVQVVLPPSHDTASAIAAAPAEEGSRWCYLSSGTWSLLGAEIDEPCITDAAAEANFTNELGVSGTVRFLKNISGLWLVQEIRRHLERDGGKAWDYAELTEQAAGAEPLRTLIPVNDPAFARPGGAVKRLQDYARQTDQPVPESVGAMVRCCLESLALEYRKTLATLESVLGREFDVLHILGGGGKNGLLNRMTAHATGKTVIVGPEEATAMGNLLTQAKGTGHLADLAAMRAVVRASIESQRVEPDADGAWAEPAARYAELPPVVEAGR